MWQSDVVDRLRHGSGSVGGGISVNFSCDVVTVPVTNCEIAQLKFKNLTFCSVTGSSVYTGLKSYHWLQLAL